MPLQNGRRRQGVAAIRVKPTPPCSGEALWHYQQSGALWGCTLLHICPTSMHFIFNFFGYAFTVTWTWIYRQRRGCAAYFASHIVLTKIYIFSVSDLRQASESHWNSKSLRLPDKLACLQKQRSWGERLRSGMSSWVSWIPAYTMISLVILRYQKLSTNMKLGMSVQTYWSGDIPG